MSTNMVPKILADIPELLKQVHCDDPNKFSAGSLKVGSVKKLIWVCDKEHMWQATVRSRAKRKTSCPYCVGTKILEGFNDLKTTHPEIANQWHPDKNGNFLPTEVGSGSAKKVYWLGECGHSWDSEVRSRVLGCGCPVCDGKKVDEATNSFLVIHPELIGWWDEKNVLSPSEVYASSNKKIQFVCPQKHHFSMKVSAFVKRKTKNKCPTCLGETITLGVNSLVDTHPILVSEWDDIKNSCLPSEISWHERVQRYWICNQGHSYSMSTRSRTEEEGKCPYCSGKKILAGFSDFTTKYPELLKEWDVVKNNGMPSESLSPTSKQKFWWRCSQGHSWQSVVGERTFGTGCPACSGNVPILGVNDLLSIRPEIAAQWHPTKNIGLLPSEVKIGSGRKVWWKATCGHEWESQIRLRKNDSCPVCTGTLIIKGENDLETLYPEVSKLYDKSLNGNKSFSKYRTGSDTNVWWRCKEGHSWKTRIRYMFIKYQEDNTVKELCPYCSGRLAIEGVNDVATLYPELTEQLDLNMHDKTALVGISYGSGKRFSWVCKKGHTWQAIVKDRIFYQTGCPDCARELWRSKGEDEVADYVKNLGFRVQRSFMLTGENKRFNYDILIPEINVLIEYNGLYYHSEKIGRDKNYHAEKLALAHDKGYTLLVVWEDDWQYRKNIIEKMIAHKLGKSNLQRVYGRTTKIVQLSVKETATFLETNHIQGNVYCSIRLGLVHSSLGLVAVLAAKIEGEYVSIHRYASSTVVIGGFGKLLSKLEETVKNNHPKVTMIKTFSDNLISDGNLYEKLDFSCDSLIAPDYMYFKGRNSREHKFNYRIKRFASDDSLIYKEGLSESELATLNNLYRVWDAGKKRWIKKI